jgi:hypothetical protein
MPACVFIRPHLRETALFRCLYIPVSDAYLEELDVLPFLLRSWDWLMSKELLPSNFVFLDYSSL